MSSGSNQHTLLHKLCAWRGKGHMEAVLRWGPFPGRVQNPPLLSLQALSRVAVCTSCVWAGGHGTEVPPDCYIPKYYTAVISLCMCSGCQCSGTAVSYQPAPLIPCEILRSESFPVSVVSVIQGPPVWLSQQPDPSLQKAQQMLSWSRICGCRKGIVTCSCVYA